MNNISTRELFASNKYDEKFLYSVNRQSFKSLSSHDVFNGQFKDKLFQESTFYVFSGTDSGLLIQYIMNNDTALDSRYLFIEQPHIISLLDDIPSKYKDRIKVCCLSDWQEIADTLDITAYIYKSKTVFVKSLSAVDLFDVSYHEINIQAALALEDKIFQILSDLSSHDFIRQQLNNISENQFPAVLLRDAFKGKTAIVLAGGPSLDESIEWVIKHRQQLLVLAVSRISKRLITVGITPDIVFSVDPFEISFEVSRDMLKFDQPPLFVHTSNAHSGLISQWHGKRAFLSGRLPWGSENNPTNVDGAGPTVTNTAVSYAVFLGVSRILLAGVDLCFSKQGTSHALGSIEAKNTNKNLSFIGKSVFTYNGDQADTTIQYELSAKALDRHAMNIADNGTVIINLSKSAIKTEHIKYIDKNEIVLSKNKLNAQAIIDKKIPDISSETLTNYNKSIGKEIKDVIKELMQIKKLAQQALACNEALFNEKNEAQQKLANKLHMDQIENELDTTHNKFSTFIKQYGIQSFVTCVQPKGFDEWSDETIAKTGEIYYQAYIDNIDILTDELNKTLQRIASRLNEDSNHPDIQKLISQWAKDKQFGRASRWLDNHIESLKKLSNDDIKHLNQQKLRFEQYLEEELSFEKQLKAQSPTDGIKTKILLLYKQQDNLGLLRLTQTLQQQAENDESFSTHYYLAQAYLLLLNKSYEQALFAFEEVPNEYLDEDDFIQLISLSIKLKIPELTQSAITILAQVNETYLPQLAKHQELNGNINESINTYSQYLNTYQNDTYIWHKIANLFLKINAFSSAKLAYQAILEIEPDNQSAIANLSALSKDLV